MCWRNWHNDARARLPVRAQPDLTHRMSVATFPSTMPHHRRADLSVHMLGLAMIAVAGSLLIIRGSALANPALLAALVVYIICALASNLASCAYHFSGWHARRHLLRRIDHAAIYPSITGTFTPFFVLAATPWTWALLVICWALTALAIWHKIRAPQIQARWSTASYLALGALGLMALPDMTSVPIETLWCIIAGACAYVIGVMFYARRSLPYRYAIWHAWVNIGGLLMFAGVWLALP